MLNKFLKFFRASARQVQVTLGDYVVNSASESLPAYTFGVREIRVHPYFKFTPHGDRCVFMALLIYYKKNTREMYVYFECSNF